MSDKLHPRSCMVCKTIFRGKDNEYLCPEHAPKEKRQPKKKSMSRFPIEDEEDYLKIRAEELERLREKKRKSRSNENILKSSVTPVGSIPKPDPRRFADPYEAILYGKQKRRVLTNRGLKLID